MNRGSAAEAQHYPAIDGLRALAVLAVVFYHLDKRLLPGGFVGVDIFFVISGFVVSLSLAQAPTDRLRSFVGWFYARRLLRIGPALVVCLLAVTLLDCLFIPHAKLSDTNAQTGVAAFFGLSNLVLLRAADDYFAPGIEFNPFAHTWSLAVEEQFYLGFPLLMFAFMRARRRAATGAVLAALCAASLLGCAWWTSRVPASAFYLLPARFWELGCGVGLFMAWQAWHPRLRVLPAARAKAMVWLLLAGVAASMLFANGAAFPFPWAIAPVLATAGLLALVVARDDRAVPLLLTGALPVGIGKLSYSLYLWHWPVFVLLRWTVGMNSLPTRALALSLALAAAAASYRWVERPLRQSPRARTQRRWVIVATSLVVLASTGALASATFSHDHRLALSTTADTRVWSPDGMIASAGAPAGCTLQVDQQDLGRGGALRRYHSEGCVAAPPSRHLFVAGDSHAFAYSAMLRRYAMQTAADVRVITKGGCALFDLSSRMAAASPDCRRFVLAAMHELDVEMASGDVLFLPSLRVPRFLDYWGGAAPAAAAGAASAAEREAALHEAIDMLAPLAGRGIRIVIEAPKPVFRAPPFRCSDWFNAHNPVCAAGFEVDRQEIEALRSAPLASIAALRAALGNVSVWDPLPALCPKPRCSAYREGRPLFYDGDHLSGLGNAVLFDSFAAFIDLRGF